MNNKRFNLIVIGLSSLLGICIIFAAIAASTILKQQSKKLLSLKLESEVLQQQQVSLANAKKDIAKYSELNREARIIVPQDKDQAQAVREIVRIARNSGISIGSILFPASTLGNSKASTSTSTTDSATAGTSTKAPTISQTQQVKGLNGVYVLPITVQSLVTEPSSYTNFIKFLSGLEQNRRTAQVTSVTINPSSDGNKVDFTLILNAYLKP